MSLRRDDHWKDLPTINEGTDIKDFTTDAFFGLFAPEKTPAPVVGKVNAALNEVLKKPEVRDGLVKLGFRIEGGTPEQLAQLVLHEDARYRVVASTVKLDR